jgi:hypothetical protein
MDIDHVCAQLFQLQSQSRRLKILIERYQAAGVNTCLVENLHVRLENRILELRPLAAHHANQSGHRPS